MDIEMKEYSINKESTVYDRSELAYQLNLASECAFSIPIGKEFEADFIDLFFNTFGTEKEGVLRVKVDFSDNTIPYEFPFSIITNEGPMRLAFGRKLKVSGFINVYLSASFPAGGETISVWMNTDGPSMKLGAFEVEKISIKESLLISIITPVYKPEANVFRAMLNSVTSQLYENWELILVDDGSRRKDIKKIVDKIEDPRIKFFSLEKNSGISAASNFGISKASGDYIGFLDHDDMITEDCLLEIVKAVSLRPHLRFIYTDEDKLDEKGRFFDAHYKPNWSYHQLLSHNYICHFSCYEKCLLKELGGFRKQYDGAQDYDLILRASKHLNEQNAYHIPKVLYHWKLGDNSTASNISNKPYAHLSALKALGDHLGTKYRVSVGSHIGVYRAQLKKRYLDNNQIHIIIPTKDNQAHLDLCLRSVMQSSHDHFSVTIVDNGSKKQSVKAYLSNAVKKYDNLNVLRYEKKFNFSDINNYAVSMNMCGSKDIIIFLNDDTEVINPDWLYELEYPINNNNVAVAGAKLLYPNNTIQHAGVFIGIGGVAGHGHKYLINGNPGYFARPHIIQEVSAVTGACLAISAKVFEEVGRFDNRLPKAFNDVDLCLRVRKAGYKIVYNPYALLYHYESVSRGVDNHMDPDFLKAINLMQTRWNCKGYNDPYYNPNLSLDRENFHLDKK